MQGKHVRWLVGLLACCAGCARGLDPSSAELFHKAQQAFDTAKAPEDYLRAAALDQQILDRGVTSGAVLFNQGNAFMQAGQRGRAIAAYRQAKRYRPRDPYLAANLDSALGTTTAPAGRTLAQHVLFWQDWLSYREKFAILALAVAMTGLAAVAAVAAVAVRRRWLSRIAWAGAAVCVVAGISALYDVDRYTWTVHGVVLQRDTVARKGNAESYEPALSRPLAEGTEFTVVERRGAWLLIRLPGDQDAWIPERAVQTY